MGEDECGVLEHGPSDADLHPHSYNHKKQWMWVWCVVSG